MILKFNGVNLKLEEEVVKRKIHGLQPILLMLLGITLIFSPTQIFAGELENPTEIWGISNGGKRYDNWAAALMKAPPDKTHPAYPASGKEKGAATWRCKECHGWDYKGKDGAYGKGSHYTGIKGIRDMVGESVDSIKLVTTFNEDHNTYMKTRFC